MAGPVSEPTVGSAAHEAARLLESLGGWFAASPEQPHPTAPPEPAAASSEQARHDATCRSCPVCRGVDAVRSVQPEVVGHLAAAAGSLASALRELARAVDRPPPEPPSGSGGPSADADRRGDPQRVRVQDDDQPDDTTGDTTGDMTGHHTRVPDEGGDEQDGAAAWG